MNTVVVHFNDDTKEYFFSTDHCQGSLSEEWVPVTFFNRDWRIVKRNYCEDSTEIDNPDPKFTPDYIKERIKTLPEFIEWIDLCVACDELLQGTMIIFEFLNFEQDIKCSIQDARRVFHNWDIYREGLI